MTETVFSCGEHKIPLICKSHERAKRLSLRLSAKDHSLVLIIPPRATASEVREFLKKCAPWVEKQLSKLTKKISLQPGADIRLHGEIFRCMVDPLRRKPALCKTTRILHLPPRYLEKDLHHFFKEMAEKILSPYIIQAAEVLDRKVEKITIRDPKSRWGSCSTNKTISLSWRLILAPPEVAHYVCVHEAVHLVHMNHSRDFWKTVEMLCPSYLTHKKWLKLNGSSLMRL